MSAETGHIGASLGAIGAAAAILGAAMAGLGAPWWAWVGFALWGLLWLTAASGLSDEPSRKFLAGTLRKSTFTQIYTTLARRNVMGSGPGIATMRTGQRIPPRSSAPR